MIDKKEVEKLADLARIEISEDEKEKLAGEIESILGYVSEIQNVSVKNEERTVGERYNVMREDANPHESGMHTEAILNCAPDRDGNRIKVKNIL